MKKILLATTLLVGTAGFAAAEVSLSGDARMGVTNNNATNDAAFSSRARVKFSLSGETDSGLSFGAGFRADNAVDASKGVAGSVFVSGAFGKLEMGDVDSAAQAAVGQVAGVGYTGLNDLNEVDYLGDSSPSALYTFSAGDLSVMASAGQISGDSAYAVAASYSMGDYTIAGALEANDAKSDDTHAILGATATFGAVKVKAIYGTLGDDSQYAVSGTYTADALSATVFHRMDLATDNTANGIGASLDLGGNASFVAGVAKEEGQKSVYDAGVTFSF